MPRTHATVSPTASAKKAVTVAAQKPAAKKAEATPVAGKKAAAKTISSPDAAPKVKAKTAKQVAVKVPSKPPKAEQTPKRVPKAKPAASAADVAVADKKADATKPKQKLVRDSFTMPQDDFVLIQVLKDRAVGFKRPTKKSELLRAGLQALVALNDAQLAQVLDGLAPLKVGRPKNGH